MSLQQLFISLVIGLVFCGSAFGQTNPPYQCDQACRTGLTATDGSSTSYANCPAFAQFQAPCTVTFQVTGLAVPAPHGPLAYVLAADTMLWYYSSSTCIGWLNLPNVSPVYTSGTIPTTGSACGGNTVATDSSITAFFPSPGITFAVQALLIYTGVGQSCDQLTQAIQITIY